MKSWQGYLFTLVSVLALASVSGGRETRKMGGLRISSPAFVHNGGIPAKFTCDGANVSPPLQFGEIPEATRSLALIVDDPDAPGGDWVHWVVWNIPPTTTSLGENVLPPDSLQGRNDWGKNSYGGPCPPSGSHRYFFKLYALDASLKLSPAAGKRELETAMDGHILARGQLVGLYRRR